MQFWGLLALLCVLLYILSYYYSYYPQNPPKPSALSTSWSGSAMGSANKNYPIGIQAKLPLTCSEKATRPFKPPSSVLTSRTSVAGTDVEEDEKEEEDIMGMYASTAEQEEKAGKEGLLSMYSSERDGGSEGESKNRSGESRNRPGASSGSAGQSRVMLSRYGHCEVYSPLV